MDGNGHKISGNKVGYGIAINGDEDSPTITLKNLNITGFQYGIYLNNPSTSSVGTVNISNNNIENCTFGIHVSAFSSCEITYNKVSQNSDNGLEIAKSDNCHLSHNEINKNQGVGIHLDSESDNAVLDNNYVCRNSQDITNEGSSNVGSNNKCGTASGWQDSGSSVDCSLHCVGWYPYNYGFSFSNPSKDDLSYGHPLDSGNYLEVFGTKQTWVSAWVCIGLVLWSPWTGWKCVGYQSYVPTIPDPHASLFFYGLLGAFGVTGWRDIAEGGECTGMSAKSLDFYYQYADNTYGSGYRTPSDFQANAQKPADLTPVSYTHLTLPTNREV